MFEIYRYYYDLEELTSLLESVFGEIMHLETTKYKMTSVARKFEI